MGDWLELTVLRNLLDDCRVFVWISSWSLASTLRWNIAIEPTINALDKVSWLVVLWRWASLLAWLTLIIFMWAIDDGAPLCSVGRVLTMLTGLRRLRTPSFLIGWACCAASVVSSKCHCCNSIDLTLYKGIRLVRRISLSVWCRSLQVSRFLGSRDRQRSCLLNRLFRLLSAGAGNNILMNITLHNLRLSLMLNRRLVCKMICRNFGIRAYFQRLELRMASLRSCVLLCLKRLSRDRVAIVILTQLAQLTVIQGIVWLLVDYWGCITLVLCWLSHFWLSDAIWWVSSQNHVLGISVV